MRLVAKRLAELKTKSTREPSASFAKLWRTVRALRTSFLPCKDLAPERYPYSEPTDKDKNIYRESRRDRPSQRLRFRRSTLALTLRLSNARRASTASALS